MNCLTFGPVHVYLGEKSGKYPDGNQVIVQGADTRVAFDTPRVANRIGPALDEVDAALELYETILQSSSPAQMDEASVRRLEILAARQGATP